ncbi:4Fe-4S dicluster domain-containing protein [Clostridium bovifaecis]|uniref:4Fe-4S dicluster domain-containing protein n=1 Tax=Clostridium bovifaecis TaxID=2184719 RepID=A0A6I6F140_9CLOT|nr:4Fe-4S dicluster domain-containing protein [Clostridium bovifaecis]
MKNKIKIDSEKCTGCFICELACSFKHTKTCSHSASRISIAYEDKTGINKPKMCIQCERALCAEACPVDAIKRMPDGVLLIDEELCIKCENCISACKLGSIKYDKVNDQIIKCDLCGGNPECVKICPSGALIYTSGDEIAADMQEACKEEIAAEEVDE